MGEADKILVNSGNAIDVAVYGDSGATYKLFMELAFNYINEFNQIIWETTTNSAKDPSIANPSWIHIALPKDGNFTHFADTRILQFHNHERVNMSKRHPNFSAIKNRIIDENVIK